MVNLGQAVTLRNIGFSIDRRSVPEAVTMTLVQVIDPIGVTAPSEPVAPGRRTIGLRFTVDNHASQPILDVWGRQELQLTFSIYGSDRNGYHGFDAITPGCPSYDARTVIAPGQTFTGCEFGASPPGVSASQVLIGLTGLGPEPTEVAAWRVPG